MAFDFDAIKKKLDELNGIKKESTKAVFWKPEIGEHRVRVLPWGSNSSEPIKERHFYYLDNAPSILAPHQFGKPDPINEFVKSLYRSGSPDDKNMAKKLLPKMRAFVPVIVRGEEDKGVQIWAFGKQVYQRLLSFFVDAEIGDITDPAQGFDLTVKVTKTVGKQFNDTTVDAARRPSRLSQDQKQITAWVSSVPDIDEIYKLKTTDEIKQILNDWLKVDEENTEQDATTSSQSQSVGTVKTSKDTTQKFSDLDAAFADLLDEPVKF